MAASYGKGDRAKATRLHSKIVRARANNTCENCGRTNGDINPDTGKPVKQIHCAHIISRDQSATRTDELNAFCLCASCHWYMGKWPIEFAKFVYATVGEEWYENLRLKAELGKGKKLDWSAELERLQRVWDETYGDGGVSR